MLADHELAALVVVATSDLTWFTGVHWGLSERLFAWVLPREGEPVFICPAFEALRAEERIGAAGRMVQWQEHEDPFALMNGLLAGPGAVAFDPRGPWTFARRTQEATARELVDGHLISGRLRRQKSEHELALMTYANALTRLAIRRAFEQLEPGVKGSQVGAWVREEHQRLGSERSWVLPLIGAAAAYPHGTAEEPALKKGDGVLIDAGCQVHGYWSDLTRTIFFGEPSAEALKAWHAVKAAQSEAFERVAPGVSAAEVDARARATLAGAGYSADYQHLTHRLGHGIGLDVHEDPYFVRDNGHLLEPGNTLSDEPGIYVPGRFGVRQEDILAVTDTGARWLSSPQTTPTVEGV